MKRRDVLAGLSVVGVGSLAGCLGALGLTEHEASPATVEDGALEETGYERMAPEMVGVDREFEVAGYSERIAVKNYVTEHDKAVDLGLTDNGIDRQRAATFMVLTTPQIGIPGQEFNPVEEMSPEELIDLIQDNYDDLSNVESDGESDVEILGQTTTQSRFTADAKFDGMDLEVFVHVSEAVETEDDLLVTIGVYPRQVQSQEEENVLSLMEAVTEDGDLTVDGDNGNESDDGDAEEDDEDGEAADGEDSDEENTENEDDEDDGVIDL